MEKIYIVLSQSGAITSRLLKFFTKDEFNHVSISLSSSLDKMYSFGRLNPDNPFIGGFVEEGKNFGTFKKYNNTRVKVLELSVSKEQYKSIKYFINFFVEHKKEFKYNYFGILCALFRFNYRNRRRFYCSQFVRICLSSFNVGNAIELPKVVKPIHFLKLKNRNVIFDGYLRNYENN